jgi:hypothetical protein
MSSEGYKEHKAHQEAELSSLSSFNNSEDRFRATDLNDDSANALIIKTFNLRQFYFARINEFMDLQESNNSFIFFESYEFLKPIRFGFSIITCLKVFLYIHILSIQRLNKRFQAR